MNYSEINLNQQRHNDSPEKTEFSHFCKKSIQLEVELQKAQAVIRKLQMRCAEKTVQIRNLKASEKRNRLARCNLEGI